MLQFPGLYHESSKDIALTQDPNQALVLDLLAFGLNQKQSVCISLIKACFWLLNI